MNFSDKELVRKLVKACQKGNRKSQKLLFETHYPKMLGVCMRYAKDGDEAEDMVQDGFIKVFEKLKYFNNKGSLEGWIRRIIMNNCVDYIRINGKLKFDRRDDYFMSSIEDQQHMDDYERELLELKTNKLVELIQNLSPCYRTVLNMFIVDNMSHKEISDRLGISEGTSKSNLFKAKENLKELYKQEVKHEHIF